MASLSPEALGEEGETLLRSLCNRAGIVANKSDKDHFGWDYLIEYLPAEAPSMPLDKRSKFTIRVQVKTSAGREKISMSLSSAERLAKDPVPAVIIYLRMTPFGEPLRGHIVHLAGPNLARLLRRLRVAKSRRSIDLNKQTISFDAVRDGQTFELSPEGLRAAVEAICGNDANAYADNKTRQLRTVGYEDGGLTAEFLVQVDDGDHMSRILMGLEPIRPTEINAFDVRFGIPLPTDMSEFFASVEEVRLTPARHDTCRLTVWARDMIRPATADMEVSYYPPNLSSHMALLRHPDFTLRLSQGATANFETIDVYERKRTLPEWITLIGMVACMAKPREMTMEFGRIGRFSLPFEITTMDGPDVDQLPRLLEFLLDWKNLLDLAGVAPDASSFEFHEVWEAKLAAAAVELNRATPRARLEWDVQELGDGHITEGFVYCRCSFGGQSLSIAARTWLFFEHNMLVANRFEVLDARLAGDDDIEDYADSIASRFELAKLADLSQMLNVDNSTV